MYLTLGQAAASLEMHKATLSRYIKQGKISAKKQEDGSYRIDPAELDRLRAMVQATPEVQPVATPGEIALLRELLHEKDKRIADLEQERDDWRDQCKKQLLLLSAPKEEPKQKRWWRW